MLKRRDVLAGGLAGVAAASFPAPVVRAQVRAFNIGHPSDVPNWDPVANGSTVIQAVHKCVFDQPLNLTPELSFGPSIVTRFQWLDKEAKVLEINLRDDVT